MKKNAKKIFVVLLLAVVACGSYFISSTYAKYTKEFGGTGEATVAKFNVSAGTLNEAKTATINLFNTIYELNASNEVDTANEEQHVNDTLIAPGTGGTFNIILTNTSEVNVEAVITLTETKNAEVPIEYSIDGGAYTPAGTDGFTTPITSVPASKTIPVKWRWVYNKSDAQNISDTGIGENPDTVKVTTNVSVVFNQVD